MPVRWIQDLEAHVMQIEKPRLYQHGDRVEGFISRTSALVVKSPHLHYDRPNAGKKDTDFG